MSAAKPYGSGRNSIRPINSQPFEEAAYDLQARGLAVMPLGGDDGKVALKAGYPRWRKAPGAKTVAQWSTEHADANIGVLCGLSGIVAIDIDDPNLLSPMLDRFGDTPLIIATRRGFQLWYRARGDERSANLRKSEGLEVEIKAGAAAIVVVPGSWNRHTGHPYRFELGSWDDLTRLPPFFSAGEAQSPLLKPPSVEALFRNHIGVRNTSLFDYLRLNFSFTSLEQVEAEAIWFNETYQIVPETRAKVLATARSVWNYMTQRGGQPSAVGAYVQIPFVELDALKAIAGKHYPQALALLSELKRQHGGRVARGELFAISAHGMADNRIIPGLTRKRIEQVRRAAEEAGLLLKIREASRESGQYRAALYTFGTLAMASDDNAVIGLQRKKT